MIQHRQNPRVTLNRSARVLVAAALLTLGVAVGCERRADAEVRQSTSPPSPSDKDGGAGVLPKAPAGEPAPLMLDIAGMRREMQKARGHMLFVHLWASWCGPCLGELPIMDRFARAARARGATVLSVSLDSDRRGIARVPQVLRDRAPALTTFVARFDEPERFMEIFSRSWEGAIPAVFAFDGTGKLSSSLIGEVEPSELDALVARLPAAAPAAPASRKRSAARPR